MIGYISIMCLYEGTKNFHQSFTGAKDGNIGTLPPLK